MNQKMSPGFTIIEVSFFLAISGLMAVGLLAGMGTTINSHRYRDSVTSLQTQLQNEFTKVENIQNSRGGRESCNSSANIVSTSSIVDPRGTTECVLLGRFIAIQGDKMSSFPVVARSTPSTNDSLNDVAYIKSHIIRIDKTASARVTENRKWGNSITYPKGFASNPKGANRNIYFLIVRSPKSGAMYSFSSQSDISGGSAGLSAMVMGSASGVNYGRTKQVLCVKQEGTTLMSPLGVVIEANISNTNGIQIISNDVEADQC